MRCKRRAVWFLALAVLVLRPATAFEDVSTHFGTTWQEQWAYVLELRGEGQPKGDPLYVSLVFHQAGFVMLPTHFASAQWLDTATGKTGQTTFGNPLMEEAARRGLVSRSNKGDAWAARLLRGFQAGKRYNFTRFEGRKGLASIGGKDFFKLQYGPCGVRHADKDIQVTCPLVDKGELAVTLSPKDAFSPVMAGGKFDGGGLPFEATNTPALKAAGTVGMRPVQGRAWVVHLWGQPPHKQLFVEQPTVQVMTLTGKPQFFQWRGTVDPETFEGPALHPHGEGGGITAPPKVRRTVASLDGAQMFPTVFTAPLPKGTKPCAALRFTALDDEQEDSLFAGLNARFQGFYRMACEKGGKDETVVWARLSGFRPPEKEKH